MKAQYTATTTTSSNSKNDYNNIIDKLTANDPLFVHVDLSALHLTGEQLSEVAGKLQNNNFVGHVTWDQKPYSSVEQPLVQQIEKKIVLNNQNYRYHPNDFVHGLLSSHVYNDPADPDYTDLIKEGANVKFATKIVPEKGSREQIISIEAWNEKIKIWNEKLQNWKILSIFNAPEAGRYYSSAYINEQTKQVVLAHRGTTLKSGDTLSHNSPFVEDFKSILGRDLVRGEIFSVTILTHLGKAYEITKEITEFAAQNHYNLSFTGHSLGAWLAELSVYFSHRNFGYSKVKAVTFDSPGSYLTMEDLKSNIISHATDFNPKDWNITTYLSAPNFVNVCNPHVGSKIYRLYPNIKGAKYTDKILEVINKPFIKDCEPLVAGVFSLAGHLIDPLLETFDPNTGKPVKYTAVSDWPCIKYNPKEGIGKKLIEVAIDHFVPGLELLPASNIIKNVLSDTIHKNIIKSTLGSFLDVVDQFISGNIQSEQFWITFSHLIHSAEQGYPLKENLSSLEEFRLISGGHYPLSQPLNLSKDIMYTQNKGAADWCLKKLQQQNIDPKNINRLIKQQLKTIKKQYKIDPNNKYYIDTSESLLKLLPDDLRDQITRLIEIDKSIKDILVGTDEKVTNSFRSNLPKLPLRNFINQKNIIKGLENNLSKEKCLVITAWPGTGKTTLAQEYGWEERIKSKDEKIIRFIEADSADKVISAYKKLADKGELDINIDGQNEEIVMRLVHNKIAELEISVLFIFDNVKKYEDIQPYITDIMNTPKNQSNIIITTTRNSLSDDLKHFKLLPFSREEATLYIKKSLGERVNDKDVSNLMEELISRNSEVLPYFLSKALAYLKENKLLGMQDYINYLKASKDDHAETALLLELLESSPTSWSILQYAARLDPDFISIEIFKNILGLDNENLQNPITRLEALSMVDLIYKNGQAGLQLHSIVQDAIVKYTARHLGSSILERDIYSKLLESFDNLLPEVTATPDEKWSQAGLIYHHVVKLLKDIPYQEIKRLEQASLYTKLGMYNQHVLNKFEESLEYHIKAQKIYKTEHLGDSLDIARAFDGVGAAYQNLDEKQKALKWKEKALKIYEVLYSQNKHPSIAKDIADSYSNIGNANRSLGEFEKALMDYKKSKKIYKSLLIGNHKDIADSLNHIGVAYEELGNHEKALKWKERALIMYKKLYPSEDSLDIAMAYNNLGVTHYSLKDIKKALEDYKKANKIYKKLGLDKDHPDIAGSALNIGAAYHDLDKKQKALKWKEKALKIYQTLYRSNHSDVALTFDSVGITYAGLNNIKKALEYFENAQKIYKALGGLYHINFIRCLNNSATAYNQAGDTIKAIELLKQSYLICNILGLETDNTYLQQVSPQFLQDKETRKFIIQHGGSNEATMLVKQAIQEKFLNRIQLLQEKDFWNAPDFKINPSMFLKDPNIHEKIFETNLWQQLEDMKTTQNLEIAKMLYFEAINLRIMAMPGAKDYSCAVAFAKKYPELIKKIANEHPEYFVDGSILRKCVSDPETLTRLLGNNNPTGQGENNYEEASYWNEYSKIAMDKMLELWLKSVGVEIDKDIKVISPNYVWDGFIGTNEKLTKEILKALESSKQALISLNLHNKHWVGISVNKTDSEIKINYLDSEQKSIPTLLKNALAEKIAASYPNFQVTLEEKTLELQKSNNCGSEVVENLIFEVTGDRLDQGSTVAVHSMLYEDSLLLGQNLSYS